MDISVSRLNGRLASKLPPELPLGLVFVVGEVRQRQKDGFVLAEGSHRLNCRAGAETAVTEGEKVRASGHLMFDPNQLQYYLLARDIEVLVPEPDAGGSRELLAQNDDLLSALAAVKARAASAPDAEGEDLPVWVQKLAPPEVQSIEPQEAAAGEEPLSKKQSPDLNTDLVAMLSEAMDSEEDMELTPELLAPYLPEEPPQKENIEQEPGLGEETAESLAALRTSYRPANRQDTDWLVILLIISFFILTIAVVVTTILLLVR